jgi:hypothetical protein
VSDLLVSIGDSGHNKAQFWVKQGVSNMSNMSYCRFQNTLADLEDCDGNFSRIESIDEAYAAIDLYRLCATIANSYDLSKLEAKLESLKQADNEEDSE